MVRDRFSEFQQRSSAHDENNRLDAQTWELGLNPDELNVSQLVQRSQQFLNHVDELRESIDTLRERIETLQQRQAAVLSQTVVRPEHKELLSALIEEIKHHTRSLRPRVRQIEDDLRRDEVASIENRSSAELRIRRNQCEVLKMRLNDLLMLFNHTQDEFKSRVSKRVKRHLDLVGEHLTSAEVDRMLDSKSNQTFYRQLRPSSFAAQSALDDATTRHNEILELEQSISELHDIFRDVYEIVHSQDTMVDDIAKNVELASENVQDARVQMTHAVTYKKSSRRHKCFLILIAIVLVLVLLVVAIVLFLNALPSGAKS